MGTSQQRNFRLLLAAKMVPEVGIAPTSPPLQGGANLPQLLGVKGARQLWWNAVTAVKRLEAYGLKHAV